MYRIILYCIAFYCIVFYFNRLYIIILYLYSLPFYCTIHPGNQCRLLLKHVKKLSIPVSLIEFEYALLALKALHITCNSQMLPHNYCQVIDNFARAWCNLSKKFNISTTPKIHILTQHLCDYFDDSDLSLIKVTDEIVESCHQFFNKKIMQGYKVKNLCNPAHGVLLYSAVRTHNTYNLKIKK